MKKSYNLTDRSDRLELYKKVLEDYQDAEIAGERPGSMEYGICEHISRMKYARANDAFSVFFYLPEIDPYIPKTGLYIAPPGDLKSRIKILKEIISKMEAGL